MAKSSPGADSFESVLRGDAARGADGGGAAGGSGPSASPQGRPSRRERKEARARSEAARAEVARAEAARGGRGVADTAATERFGWGAATFEGDASLYESGSRVGSPYAVAGSGNSYSPPQYDDMAGYTSAVEPPRPTTPEAIIARTRPHARRLTIPVLLLFATTAAYGWFGGRFPEEWQNWAALAAAGALVFFGVLLPFLAWVGHRYTITTRRIIARHGLVVRHRQDVYLARISDVRLRRTPLQAAFASGNVRVVAGPDLVLIIHDVPSARLVADLLGDLTEHPTPPSHLPPP
ncbi:PH domain-containing protein [Herbiconiux daphne]|uniref:PH domain-containing protein n=1 Tax=Herbiconiux daphne TaxID=2970914 RepID=A0ABT2H4L7_9MICO|nr:PH domain-containing protein [Herbiconiux daphne]MCS5734861.1 PH domain-containing protein [Herbiconiux daphne]